MYGAVQTMRRIFHCLMKIALTPTITRPIEKNSQSIIPANGRYLVPANSDAITNICTPVPGVKKPTITRESRNGQYTGRNALINPVIIITAMDGKSTILRPNLVEEKAMRIRLRLLTRVGFFFRKQGLIHGLIYGKEQESRRKNVITVQKNSSS